MLTKLPATISSAVTNEGQEIANLYPALELITQL
jgi:hypothetical protein